MKITKSQAPGSNVYGDRGHIIADILSSIERAGDPLMRESLRKRLRMLRNNKSRYKRYKDYCSEMVESINRDPNRAALVNKNKNSIWVEDSNPPKDLMESDHGNAVLIRKFHGQYARKPYPLSK